MIATMCPRLVRCCIIPLLAAVTVHCFSVERKNIAGIWKLKLADNTEDPLSAKANRCNEILLRIQEDGSFQQCNDDGNNWLKGCWEFTNQEQQLQLAMDRDCDLFRDTLLSGKVKKQQPNEESSAETFSITKGVISAGKFMYKPSHFAFFDQPMAASVPSGKFTLEQVFGFSKLMIPVTPAEPEIVRQFQTSDFFDRKFFMTVVPVEANKNLVNPLEGQQPVDIRTMPTEFFANSTFRAQGTNKILRGRFEVTKKDQLYFHVSRFGSGRSTPGSVYSEGIGLSHEDERSYLGNIQKVENKQGEDGYFLRVEGTVTFGADLGTDARPEPVGTFLLQEVNDTSLDMKDEDEEEEEEEAEQAEDDIFDSVWE